MFKLPKECITGHVEGGTFIHVLLTRYHFLFYWFSHIVIT